MSIVLRCPDCERETEVAEPPSSGKVMCPTCLTMLTVPGLGAEEEDEGGVYTTAAVKRCPQCNQETTAAAVLCVNCGFHYQTGKKLKQVVRVKTVEHEWWFGLIPLFFSTVRLRKTRNGERLVTVTQSLFFIPVSTAEVDLREGQEIFTDFRKGFGVFGLITTVLLVLFCVVPGLFWWVWAFNKPTYIVQLPRPDLSPLTLYEGMSEQTMRTILDHIAEMGQVKIVRK